MISCFVSPSDFPVQYILIAPSVGIFYFRKRILIYQIIRWEDTYLPPQETHRTIITYSYIICGKFMSHSFSELDNLKIKLPENNILGERVFSYLKETICLENIHHQYLFIHKWLYSPLLGPGLFFSFVILFTQTVRLLGCGISSSQGRYLHTGQHKHRIKAHTDIQALSGIGTHDSNVRASEDSSCVRPRGHCDRPSAFQCVWWTEALRATDMNSFLPAVFWMRSASPLPISVLWLVMAASYVSINELLLLLLLLPLGD
jgi:hypothetical protein